MRDDIKRWEEKYQHRRNIRDLKPDRDLLHSLHYFPARGIALDVACGLGDDSIALLDHGLEVIAIDGSLTALKLARQRLSQSSGVPLQRYSALVCDLNKLHIDARQYAAIIMLRYLDFSLLKRLQTALKPRGLFFYKTFNQHHLNDHPGFNPNFVLRDGDLQQAFHNFEILKLVERSSGSSYIVARKGAGSAGLK